MQATHTPHTSEHASTAVWQCIRLPALRFQRHAFCMEYLRLEQSRPVRGVDALADADDKEVARLTWRCSHCSLRRGRWSLQRPSQGQAGTAWPSPLHGRHTSSVCLGMQPILVALACVPDDLQQRFEPKLTHKTTLRVKCKLHAPPLETFTRPQCRT